MRKAWAASAAIQTSPQVSENRVDVGQEKTGVFEIGEHGEIDRDAGDEPTFGGRSVIQGVAWVEPTDTASHPVVRKRPASTVCQFN